MSREKQIDIIINLLTDFDEMGFIPTTTVPDPEAYAVEWRNKLTNALQGYRKSEWISVEEGLPECERGAESKAVLFITKQGFMYTGYYGCGGIFRDRYFREFKNATEGYDISNVTHWMPLPEAPKGGGK